MIFTFAGTLAHFINSNWEMVERVVDFCHLEEKDHTGPHAAKAFVWSASKCGGLNKISHSHTSCSIELLADMRHPHHFLAIAMDNASTCNLMASYIGRILEEKYKIHFHLGTGRIHCSAHIVNLVVQMFLSQLENSGIDNPNIFDHFLPDKSLPVHYRAEDDEELRGFEQEDLSGVSSDMSAEEPELDDIDILLPVDFETLSPITKVRMCKFSVISC